MVSLKNLENFLASGVASNDSPDILSDVRYICSSSALITEALQRGCDVLQMTNGDIVITELKPVAFQYTWDEKRGKLVRVKATQRVKRPRKQKLGGKREQFEEVALSA